MSINVTKENFKREVMQSDKPVLIDFWAPWCGPCRRVAPIVDEISEETSGTIKVGKINIDEQPELAEHFQILSIPTIIVMNKGKVKSSAVGAKSKSAILEMLS